MRIKNTTLLLTIFLIVGNVLSAQENEQSFKGLKDNVVHFTPGIQGLTLTYERKLWHPKNPKALFKTITGRFEGGLFQSALNQIGEDETLPLRPFYALSVAGISGKGNNHLEFGFGVLRGEYGESIYCCLNHNYDIYPNLGYRFQKPNGKFVFRAGASHPRYTYISVGYAF